METTEVIKPTCSACGGELTAGSSWVGSNHCRAMFIADHLADGETTWEFCQRTGMDYQGGVRGFMKARDMGYVDVMEREQRVNGGERFRYARAADWYAKRVTAMEAHEKCGWGPK